MAGGAGAAALAEHLDHSIRTPEQLVRVAQAFPLAVIPYLPNKTDLARAMRRRSRIRLAGLGAVAIALCSVMYSGRPWMWCGTRR